VRRQQQDVSALVKAMQDLSEHQSRLFLVAASFLVTYEPPALHGLVDDDVIEAMAALAGTFETASRGVIYEHRPSTLPAERLAQALKPKLSEARESRAGFERDVAVVLRRIEVAAREIGRTSEGSRRGFLDLIGRVLGKETPEPRPVLLS
jgi:hypothetical protein